MFYKCADSDTENYADDTAPYARAYEINSYF